MYHSSRELWIELNVSTCSEPDMWDAMGCGVVHEAHPHRCSWHFSHRPACILGWCVKLVTRHISTLPARHQHVRNQESCNEKNGGCSKNYSEGLSQLSVLFLIVNSYIAVFCPKPAGANMYLQTNYVLARVGPDNGCLVIPWACSYKFLLTQ